LPNSLAEASQGRLPASGSSSLGEFFEQWFDHIRPTRLPTTIHGYTDKIRRINTKPGPMFCVGRTRLS